MDERVKTLNKIGMKDLSKKLQKNLTAQALIDKYAAMKFKVTDIERIRKQLCSKPLNKERADRIRIGYNKWNKARVRGLIGIPIGILGAAGHSLIGHPLHMYVAGVGFGLTIVSIIIAATVIELQGYGEWRGTSYRYPELRRRPLSKWKDNLPQGAIYALQEAKEKGLSKFEIYYPVKNVRLKADPVIVGYDKKDKERKVMFEIFAWDDGKTYDPVLKPNEEIID